MRQESTPPTPAAGLTLGEMRERRWIITAFCPLCRLRVHVDLAALAQLKGADYVLRGRRARCKAVAYTSDGRCEGSVVFEAAAIKGSSMRRLEMSGEVRDALRLRSQALAGRR